MAETYTDVWDALVDDPAEREACKIKSNLMAAIAAFIKQNGMTQQQTTDKMGVSQPRVSDVVRAKGERFTIDMLVNMLTSLGLRLDIRLRDAA